MSHTILLYQITKNKQTRKYDDFESVGAAVEGIVKMYEKRLQELNPNVPNITYDVKDLYTYMDHLGDMCALVFDANTGAYRPHDKEWLKERLLAQLKKAAGLR